MHFDRVIVVDDDPVMRRILVAFFQKQHAPVLGVSGVHQALEENAKEPADLLICDLQLDDGTGIDVLKAFREQGHTFDAIIMTAFGSIETAVDAMKMGASNYLLKPFTLAQFEVAINQLVERRRLRTENAYLKEELVAARSEFEPNLGPSLQAIDALVSRVAPTDATVLIQGESGTGKEVIARLIYQRSHRHERPYVTVNCAAIPDTLLESEFFGHEKGAFTGAVSRRQGRFELAHGGTLLLDEVTEIPLPLQAKLLRVLQEREFERVGGSRTIKTDVRLLATTNRDPEQAIRAGAFREDLFFRLNVVTLRMPPLRERHADLDGLVRFFLKTNASRHNKDMPEIEPRALDLLRQYDWPGNVRELQNCCERAIITAEAGQPLNFRDFGLPDPIPADHPLALRDGQWPTIADMERRLIKLVLSSTSNHQKRAAEVLGITDRTLRNKLKEYGEL